MQTLFVQTDGGIRRVVDVGVVRNYIKPKADSTLYNMRKADLIEYIRTLEHNYNVAVSFNENQAKYIEQLGFDKVVRCKDCRYWQYVEYGYGECTHKRFHLDGHPDPTMEINGFCSCGERRTDNE